MAFWSTSTLRSRLPALIVPFEQSKIDCVSYQLSIGAEAYVTPLDDAKPAERAKRVLKAGDSVVIPRGQFAFLITSEEIYVPDDAVAFISIKAKIKFRGLVNVSGFHVDPGYSGKLVFSVFNAGASDVILHRDDPAFLIWYASLDEPCTDPKRGRGFVNIPSELINGIADDSLSLARLDSKVKKLDDTVKLLLYTATVLVTLFLAITAGWVKENFGSAAKTSDRTEIEARQ